jgi:hypothetical protein
MSAEVRVEQTWRGYLLVVCMVACLGAAGWSAVLAVDETRDQTVRTVALGGVLLCSLAAGRAAGQLLKPWLKARASDGPTRLTR